MNNLAQICHTMARWLNEPLPQNPNWSPKLWETFQFASRVHGVAPLLYEKLNGADWLDSSLKAWLAEQYAFNAQRLAKMQGELKEILALFNRHGLSILPLKGSILAEEFYKPAGLRPMADLDVLLRPEDLAMSTQLLAQLGYQQDVVHWKHLSFIKPDNRQVVSKDCEHPDNPRGLEVHLYCRESFGGPTVELTQMMWQRAYPGNLLGESTLIPDLEALWLHLLAHTSYHMWQGKGRLIHLVDLARVTPRINHPLLLLNTVEARFTYPGLVLLKKYFPAALDDALLAAQQVRVSSSFQGWAAALDLVNTSYLNPKPPGLYLVKALKFTEGRPSEVLQALRFAFLPGLEEIALDHPTLARSKIPWLAYLLLPVDWARRVFGASS